MNIDDLRSLHSSALHIHIFKSLHFSPLYINNFKCLQSSQFYIDNFKSLHFGPLFMLNFKTLHFSPLFMPNFKTIHFSPFYLDHFKNLKSLSFSPFYIDNTTWRVSWFYFTKHLSKPKYSTSNTNISLVGPKTPIFILILLLMCGDTGVGINPGPIALDNHLPTFHIANIQNLTGNGPFVKKMEKIGFLQEQ